MIHDRCAGTDLIFNGFNPVFTFSPVFIKMINLERRLYQIGDKAVIVINLLGKKKPFRNDLLQDVNTHEFPEGCPALTLMFKFTIFVIRQTGNGLPGLFA